MTESISYIIVRGDTGRFRLDENSGRLTTNQELDYERQTEYSLTISTRQASGENNPVYSCTVSIAVIVSARLLYFLHRKYMFKKKKLKLYVVKHTHMKSYM